MLYSVIVGALGVVVGVLLWARKRDKTQPLEMIYMPNCK